MRSAPDDLRRWPRPPGSPPPPPVKALPWLLRLERWSLGHWELVTDGQVRCPYCGSDQVGRKSAKPRQKKYYDEARPAVRGGGLSLLLPQPALRAGQLHQPAARAAALLALPHGGAPAGGADVRLGLLDLPATGAALGVASLTAWRWVSAWGDDLLPVAALFGVVSRSGVVGVDEKYVLVPKNDKPAGKMRRWMYVYLAVDVWTYDLLHIAIYPDNDPDSAEAFLLALRAKGYQPQVLVTDLRQDYAPVIAQVFPQAVHHLCIFHALQDVQKHIKDVYGPDYAEQHPEAERLKQHIYAIFDADTLALATERYAAVLALRQDYVQPARGGGQIFDFLERHWPKLANASAQAPSRRPTTPSSWSSAASTSTTRTSAALSRWPMPSATWPSSRSSIASRPFRKMPSPASAASRPCNWLATTSPACP